MFLLAFLGDAVECLRGALERERVGSLRSFRRRPLHHHCVAAPHGVDHASDLGGGFRILLGCEIDVEIDDDVGGCAGAAYVGGGGAIQP